MKTGVTSNTTLTTQGRGEIDATEVTDHGLEGAVPEPDSVRGDRLPNAALVVEANFGIHFRVDPLFFVGDVVASSENPQHREGPWREEASRVALLEGLAFFGVGRALVDEIEHHGN